MVYAPSMSVEVPREVPGMLTTAPVRGSPVSSLTTPFTIPPAPWLNAGGTHISNDTITTDILIRIPRRVSAVVTMLLGFIRCWVS